LGGNKGGTEALLLFLPRLITGAVLVESQNSNLFMSQAHFYIPKLSISSINLPLVVPFNDDFIQRINSP
jgi:hypothetical protein